jgi:uncharacterized spore protein YtfJ
VNSVKFPEVLDQLPNHLNVRRVYGEPYVTPDGVTVIPVAKIREGRGFVGSPIGVFVVRGMTRGGCRPSMPTGSR